MKILQINTIVNSGSTGRIADQIGQFVSAHGWESYIAFGRRPRKSFSQLIRIGSFLDIIGHVFQTRLFDRHGLASKKATRKLVSKIKILNPDIIHLHNIHGYYLNYEILFNYLAKSNIPVVWTLHDCWAFTGHCTHFAFTNCSKWHAGCYDCPLISSYPQSLYFDRSKKNYTQKRNAFTQIPNLTIVAVSDWLANMVKESYLSIYPVVRIHNGVDTSVFCRTNLQTGIKKKYSLSEKKILLGVASVWNERKGFFDYIQLAKILSSEYLILLIGLNKKQILQLPGNIIGIERTESVSDMVELYCEASIVLNLSYEETFGLTSVEGMSCGTPTIVYNSTASPELVSEDTGIIMQPGDVVGIANAITELMQRDKIALENACRKRAIEYFDSEKYLQSYLDLYNQLLRKE